MSINHSRKEEESPVMKMIMRRLISVAAAMTALLIFSACSAEEPQKTEEPEAGSGFVMISAEEAKAMMDSEEDFVLLDVRTEEEFAEEHIPGAILLPHTEISEKAEELLPDREKSIFIYCRSGRRSKIAAEELSSLGYEKVFEFGGIIDWPFETE